MVDQFSHHAKISSWYVVATKNPGLVLMAASPTVPPDYQKVVFPNSFRIRNAYESDDRYDYQYFYDAVFPSDWGLEDRAIAVLQRVEGLDMLLTTYPPCIVPRVPILHPPVEELDMLLPTYLPTYPPSFRTEDRRDISKHFYRDAAAQWLQLPMPDIWLLFVNGEDIEGSYHLTGGSKGVLSKRFLNIRHVSPLPTLDMHLPYVQSQHGAETASSWIGERDLSDILVSDGENPLRGIRVACGFYVPGSQSIADWILEFSKPMQESTQITMESILPLMPGSQSPDFPWHDRDMEMLVWVPTKEANYLLWPEREKNYYDIDLLPILISMLRTGSKFPISAQAALHTVWWTLSHAKTYSFTPPRSFSMLLMEDMLGRLIEEDRTALLDLLNRRPEVNLELQPGCQVGGMDYPKISNFVLGNERYQLSTWDFFNVLRLLFLQYGYEFSHYSGFLKASESRYLQA